MRDYLIRLLGLKGSWKWACKQMDKGAIVRPSNATGSVCYKLDHEGQRRIVWAFNRHPIRGTKWENANIFLSDFESTDWIKDTNNPSNH
jgi:protein involved in temperature-dependent protein secretion